MRLKAGDTTPSVTIACIDGDSAVNLTSAASVAVVGTKGGETIFTDTTPTVTAATGLVTHRWTAPETDDPGRLWLEVRVVWGDLRPQTFPPFGKLPVDIE